MRPSASRASRSRLPSSAAALRTSAARRKPVRKKHAIRSCASRSEQRAADDLLTRAQRRLFDAREAMQAQAHRAAEAKASHATLVERAGALAADVQRLEAASAELESRLTGRRDDLQRNETRRTELGESIVTSEATLDEGLRNFDSLRDSVRQADERSQALRTEFEDQDGHIREARRALEGVRAEAAQFDVARATAESDLAHLASTCVGRRAGDARRGRGGSRTARARRRTCQPDGRWTMRLRRQRPKTTVCATPPRMSRPRQLTRRRPSQDADARRDGGRPARQGRAHGRREHDGDRPVRRPRVAPRVPDRAAEGPRRLHRLDQRSDPQDRQDDARSASAKPSRSSTRISRARSRRCSAAAAPA